jgi:hypothetical protein
MMKIKELSTLLIWIVSESVVISFGIFEAFRDSSVLLLFLITFTAWSMYLGIHYYLTGRFIDSNSDKGNKPDLISVTGFLSMISAFPVGVFSLNIQDFHLMVAAQVMFLVGYTAVHKQITG